MKYSFRNNNKILSGLVVLALSGILLSFNACQSGDEPDDMHDVASSSNSQNISELLERNPKIKIGELTKQTISKEVHCTGMIDLPPTELVYVHSRTAGFVRRLKYIPGDYVKKGTLLALIENPKLIEAQRKLMETKAELVFANSDFERKRLLKESNAIPEKSYQEALSIKNRLMATYEGLKSELSLLGINIDALEHEHKYQSSIGVYAGTSGYVHSVNVNMGEMIHPEDKLMEIANNDHMHLELNVLSKDVPSIKKGQKVRFRLPSGNDVLSAEVVKINPLVDAATNTMSVHCHIEKSMAEIKPGLFANAIVLGEPEAQVGLSLDAVTKYGEKYFAYRIVNQELKRELLKNPVITGEWVTFDNNPVGEWVISGVYYLGGGE